MCFPLMQGSKLALQLTQLAVNTVHPIIGRRSINDETWFMIMYNTELRHTVTLLSVYRPSSMQLPSDKKGQPEVLVEHLCPPTNTVQRSPTAHR